MQDRINVISPLIPDLEEFIPMLRDIWNRKWITNAGHYHELLEAELAKYLGVEYLSLFANQHKCRYSYLITIKKKIKLKRSYT